ncbi:hypothetical protein H5410_004274 [Solanum commersonii]|uniref:Uncharacterized protein n=1 Tax=Solanum commersonii TaxID=4109 RepID=A0A9J6B6Y4_SOLCO|nr:hypothetical protein H5410_004274 [Solanum commersonii]
MSVDSIYIDMWRFESGELKNLRNVVAEAKAKDVKVVPAVVKRMLDRNMFLFGFVDVNQSSAAERLDELSEGLELEVDLLKQKSADYARAKDLAIKEASDIVDVDSIKHIAENQTLIGDVVGKTADDWKAQKELFYQKTGILHQPVKDSVDVVGEEHDKSQQEGAEEHDKSQQEVAEEQDKTQQKVAEEQDDNENFSKELEEVLLFAQNESDFEE